MQDVRRILQANAMHLVDMHIDTATPEQDMKQATDMVVTISSNKSVAVRVRRPHYDYRDLTIRSSLPDSPYTTEIDKLRDGFGDIYLYGWTTDRRIREYILVNIQSMRDSGLLYRQWRVIGNRDGRNGFIAIPAQILYDEGCLINHNLQSVPPVIEHKIGSLNKGQFGGRA